MTGEPVTTIVGNLTADPELRFTPSGAAVANFTIASTPRFYDRQSNSWKDGETLFMRCSLWREPAENVAESLTKGTRVIATGRIVSRSFDTKEGEKRHVTEMQVDEIGPSLRYATAAVTKTTRNNQYGPPADPPGTSWGTSDNHAPQQAARPTREPETTNAPNSSPDWDIPAEPPF